MNDILKRLATGQPISQKQLREFYETTEGKFLATGEERSYRKGFWDGVQEVIKLLNSGAEQRQVEELLWNKLKDWKNGDCTKFEPYPKIVPWRKLRKAILESYDYKCAYCGQKASHVDHIIPVSGGGFYDPDNLAASCETCNLKKGSKPFQDVGLRIRFFPVKQVRIKNSYNEVDIEVI